MANVYFDLTREFNADGANVVLQQLDRERMERYLRASERYLAAVQSAGVTALPLADAHVRLVELADKLLPVDPGG